MTRAYLTRAKIDALLELARHGEEFLADEIAHITDHGNLEPQELEPQELETYERHCRTIDLAREARHIIRSRGGVRLS